MTYLNTIISLAIHTYVQIHEFYCDQCGKFLDESEEDDDGYYEQYGELTQSVLLFGHWYDLEMCLCDECFEKKKKEILDGIKRLGFTYCC